MRILIATVTAGSGHLQAAAALEEAWRTLRPKDQLQKLDVLDFTPRLYRKVYIDSYVKVVEHAPDLWAHMFTRTDNPEVVRKLTRFRRTLAHLNAAKFFNHLRKFKPEAVFCTHYMPLGILADLRVKRGPSPFVVSVITDFEAHALWMESGVDLYCVAAEETKVRLLARGIPSAKIIPTGIPVSSRFAAKVDAGMIRKRMGLRDDIPILLVLGGGFGMGPLGEILEHLKKLQHPVQILVVCGNNLELRQQLACKDYPHPTRVLGFVQNMQELMAISELVITKPGGLTSSEALAMGKPIFILNPIPGQEAANSDFLLEHGAAAKANRLEDLPYRLNALIGSEKLEAMTTCARRLGRPFAALEICREVVRRLQNPPAPAPRYDKPTPEVLTKSSADL